VKKTLLTLSVLQRDCVTIALIYLQIPQGEHLPASVAPAIIYATHTSCAQRMSVGGGHGEFIAAGNITWKLRISCFIRL
jgi:hypothetical protein